MDKICKSDVDSAKEFLNELQSYKQQIGNKIGLLEVVNLENPTKPIIDEGKEIYDYISKVDHCITSMKNDETFTTDIKCDEIINVMKVCSQLRSNIEFATREPSKCSTWFDIRKRKITAWKCHEVVTFIGSATGVAKKYNFSTFFFQRQELVLVSVMA